MSRSSRDYRYAGAARAINFVPDAVAAALSAHVPRAAFAFLLGSAKDGCVPPTGDLDLAIWYAGAARVTWRLISHTIAVVEQAAPKTVCDLGILNSAGCVYRFEALQGRLLFCRPRCLEAYAGFYAQTCRDYEETMALWQYWRAVAA